MIIKLPVPPSTNALYVNRKGGKGYGRIKSQKYRDWLKSADQWLLAQWRKLETHNVSGPCVLSIRIPKVRGDATNRIKAAEDFLVSRLITDDDRHNREVTIKFDESLSDHCEIEVRAA